MKNLEEIFSNKATAKVARHLSRLVAQQEPLHNRDNCAKAIGDMIGEESNKIHNAPVNEFIDHDIHQLYEDRERGNNYIPLNNYAREKDFAS